MELFNKDLNIKELRKITRYNDLEDILLGLKDKADVKEISESSFLHKKIYAIEKGNEKGQKFLITSANHGGEEAGTIAALQIAKEIAEPNHDLKYLLDDIRIIVIPCIDPDGFDLRARKFVDQSGNAELWPVDRGRRWEDINGVWNRKQNLPDQIKNVRGYIDNFDIDLAFDLHETVPLFGEKEHIFKNYGLLVLEVQPNCYNDTGKAIIKNLKNNYFSVFKSALFDMLNGMSPLPQTKTKDEGRATTGPLIKEFRKSFMVLSDYIARKNGIQAYTFETFFTPLDYRVGAHLAGVEGGISSLLNCPLDKKIIAKEELIKRNKQEQEIDGKKIKKEKEDFYLQCREIAQEKLGEHGIRVYKPNRIKLFDFPKEVIYAWSREGKGQLEFSKKFGKICVKYLKSPKNT